MDQGVKPYEDEIAATVAPPPRLKRRDDSTKKKKGKSSKSLSNVPPALTPNHTSAGVPVPFTPPPKITKSKFGNKNPLSFLIFYFHIHIFPFFQSMEFVKFPPATCPSIRTRKGRRGRRTTRPRRTRRPKSLMHLSSSSIRFLKCMASPGIYWKTQSKNMF